jgi:hypothetical protein
VKEYALSLSQVVMYVANSIKFNTYTTNQLHAERTKNMTPRTENLACKTKCSRLSLINNRLVYTHT